VLPPLLHLTANTSDSQSRPHVGIQGWHDPLVLTMHQQQCMPQSPTKPLPLLTLPSEFLQLVALHFTAAPSNLGPPAALLQLLSVSPAASAPGLGAELAKVGWAKFTSCEEREGFVLYEGYLWLGLVMIVAPFPVCFPVPIPSPYLVPHADIWARSIPLCLACRTTTPCHCSPPYITPRCLMNTAA
jgi:hypothetical protein